VSGHKSAKGRKRAGRRARQAQDRQLASIARHPAVLPQGALDFTLGDDDLPPGCWREIKP